MANTKLITRTPGVYIEEIVAFPPSVAAVQTAIPAFIGHTQVAREKVDGDLTNKPKRITSFVEYRRFFGEAQKEINIEVRITTRGSDTQVNADFQAGSARSRHIMFYALQAYFDNGGGPCWIVSVGPYSAFDTPIAPAPLQAGLAEVAKVDEVTLLVFPEERGIATPADYQAVHASALRQCFDLQDRFAIMSLFTVREQTSQVNVQQDADDFRALSGNFDDGHVKYGAAYYPNIDTIFNYDYEEAAVTISHTIDGNPGDLNGITLDALKAQNNALYNRAKGAIDNIPCRLPPSAIMAGIYADVDNARGVWKAPANVTVKAVVAPTVTISDKDQENLNIDVNAGRSINAIRTFVGRGTRVWGARTLAGNDNEWRYINVRRFFNFAEESIKKATNQFVFEPNDANTWTRVRSMIENFLIVQWRAGALQGATPEAAFYVRVGLNQTMTALDILEGRMIVEVGMAVVRPAEFIILQFIQKMPES
jgi:hypothetical protein